ncbi:phosphoribosylanthranilate isomerase [uncultured Bilophila sp.]|uniref:phosphoribosylanthranilate isomerase n=1 Tax=uncultured Bilophila sp. TaxID=529385 RepID=UPI0025FCB855|nr:phosphoribosylanthranilate isomerase [uncultured Bilophila sp.]
MNDLLIKLCGMREQALLDCAADLGVNLCGFIFAPESPRAVTPERAAALDSRGMLRVGVFTTDDMRFIEATAATARLDRVQLHGDQSVTCAERLSRTLGAERLIRVLWPRRYPDRHALEADMERHAHAAGMFLLDAGTSGGGSGQRVDGEGLRGLHAPRPWLLAGGLTPENVREAVEACAPHGVDFNSGLESEPGRKDPSRIRAALTALRGKSS